MDKSKVFDFLSKNVNVIAIFAHVILLGYVFFALSHSWFKDLGNAHYTKQNLTKLCQSVIENNELHPSSKDAWGNDIILIENDEDRVGFLSKGKDGRQGTADDITIFADKKNAWDRLKSSFFKVLPRGNNP